VDGSLGAYHSAYDAGDIDTSALGTLYTQLQTLTGNHQAELGGDYGRYLLMTKHVLYLRFWPNITSHFWETTEPP
jgi:hypothetical protein